MCVCVQMGREEEEYSNPRGHSGVALHLPLHSSMKALVLKREELHPQSGGNSTSLQE